MTLRELILPEFDQEMANTRKLLELVPDDKLDYKPHEKSMSLAVLAGHLSEFAEWVQGTIEMEVLDIPADYKPFVPQSRAEILAKFDQSLGKARELLSQASDEDLWKIWKLNWGGQEIISQPRYTVLRGWC
jgi:uncharacterized damage-inducible protein DinB